MQAVRGTDSTVAFKSMTSSVSTAVHVLIHTGVAHVPRFLVRMLLPLRAQNSRSSAKKNGNLIHRELQWVRVTCLGVWCGFGFEVCASRIRVTGYSESIRKSIEPSWNRIYGLGRLGNGCWSYVARRDDE
jgi:hypothetical protein